MTRITIALRYRSGAEVQVAERALDSAAVISGDLLQALLNAAIDRRESVEMIHHGKSELVIRIADRSYEPMAAEKHPPRPKRVPPPGEF